jgi:hypothetical protein
MTSEDWSKLVMISNDSAMRWYQVVTQKSGPVPTGVVSVGASGVTVGEQGGLLMLAVLAVVVVFLLR